MLSRRILWVPCLLVIFTGSAAFATFPADQTIQWRFRQTPTDSTSPIDFRVIATLKAVERNKNKVGWEVQSLEFFQILDNESKTWAQSFPELATSDGLWWVTHNNPLSPVLNEFINSPLFEGVAVADNPADADLSYNLKSSPTGFGVYPNTAHVTYAMQPLDPEYPQEPQPPIRSGEDEPVEVDESRDLS